MNKKRIVAEAVESGAGVECKYCMLGELEEAGGFLCSPCSCSGTCALVHFSCLEKWNRSKVKKEVVGGTTQYNFDKFNCEVCRAEYPRFIEKDGQEHELLPIDRPQGHHLVLESVSDKANNMMLLQDIEKEGVRIGRGHECEIRVADISVSRSHARIARVGSDYFIFDNKSKFGTLVKEPRLTLDLARSKQGVQVGRTVLTFEISKTFSFEVNFAKHPAEE